MLTAAATDATPTASADVDLVRRLKAGDEDAYAIVVRTLGGRMLSVARRFLHDEERPVTPSRTPSSRRSAPSTRSTATPSSPPGCTASSSTPR